MALRRCGAGRSAGPHCAIRVQFAVRLTYLLAHVVMGASGVCVVKLFLNYTWTYYVVLLKLYICLFRLPLRLISACFRCYYYYAKTVFVVDITTL